MNCITVQRLDHETIEEWGSILDLAAQEVFSMMVGAALEPSRNLAGESLGVTGMVGLAGKLCGLLTIQCSAECAGLIASGMLGTAVSGQDQCVLDALGEICNMVAGNFKPKIPGLEDQCVLSIPTVIRGSDYRVRTVGGAQVLESRQEFHGCLLQIKLVVHKYQG
jgi:chemotaxis protein CheX